MKVYFAGTSEIDSSVKQVRGPKYYQELKDAVDTFQPRIEALPETMNLHFTNNITDKGWNIGGIIGTNVEIKQTKATQTQIKLAIPALQKNLYLAQSDDQPSRFFARETDQLFLGFADLRTHFSRKSGNLRRLIRKEEPALKYVERMVETAERFTKMLEEFKERERLISPSDKELQDAVRNLE
ncbi:MAG TPA: hypothetical protein V6C52_09000 [Coleofasciculaceae cyanobacterium]|jgi:hypothetical protein